MTDIGMYNEHSKVQYGLTPIEYRIRRSPRRLTVSIALDPEMGVLVTAPEKVSRQRIDGVILDKGHWIAKGLRRLSDRPPPSCPKAFVSGEGFSYLGHLYRLRLETGNVRPLELRNGLLSLPVPPPVSGLNLAAYTRAALIDWYRAQASKYLALCCRMWANNLKVELKGLALSEPVTRWGSTSKDGTVRFNWRIVQAPKTLIDYVVAHELCHLAHRDHSKDFWGMLGAIMPDYEARKRHLREVGPAIIW